MEKYICIGEIRKPQGIKGDLKISVLLDQPDNIAKLKTIFIGENLLESKVLNCYKVSNDYAINVSSVNCVDEANKLRGQKIYALREDIDKFKNNNSFYIADLISKTAVFEDGEEVGVIDDVQNFGASDIVYLKSSKRKNLCFANVGDVIKSIDYDNNKVIICKKEFDKVSVSD